MGNFFGKALDEIDEQDIHDLIDTPEGQLFEIKESLPAEKGASDSWYNEPAPGMPRKGPQDYAKQNIFKELVAFANSEGGWLVLGLEETNDQPKRVKRVSPLPDCHELAFRFARAAFDWIDPPMPSLVCRGIPVGNVRNEGIVAFYMPRSVEAPHRLYKKGRSQEAYKRVGDESKPMRMREIQDLTLETYRGLDRINKQFELSKDRYIQILPERGPLKDIVGLRISLVPLTPLTIDRPYLQQHLFERNMKVRGSFKNGSVLDLETMDSSHSSRTVGVVRPLLRGANRTWSCNYDLGKGPNQDKIVLEIMANGAINLFEKSTNSDPAMIAISWILSEIANALIACEQVRRFGKNPGCDYILEIEIKNEMRLPGVPPKPTAFCIGLLGEEYPHASGKFCSEPLSLPRYRVGRKVGFHILIQQVMDDLYNAVGKIHRDDFSIDPLI